MTSFLPQALSFLGRRKQAYQKTFGIPGTEGHVALVDLAKYCRAFSPLDEIIALGHDAQLIAFGRRDAFWRIYNHLNLNEIELAAVYKAVVLPIGE